MILVSPLVVGLCVILFAVGQLQRPLTLRPIVVFLANLAFVYVAAGDGRVAWPALAIAGLGYAALFVVRRSRLWLALSIAAIVALFLYVKRYPGFDALPLWEQTVSVVGASYVLFRTLHILIDFSEGSLRQRPTAVEYLNYNFFFLSFLSGPIQRFEDFGRSDFFASRVRLPIDEVGRQIARAISGLFKVLFASGLFDFAFRSAVDAMLDASSFGMRSCLAAAAALAFASYLYVNFSGYMDIVISVGRLLGFKLPENFDRPFKAANIQELWTRWHITLSQWIRTYLFSPLLKFLVKRDPSPRGAARAGAISLFASFFIIGAWHSGSVLGFVYGGLLASGAVTHRLWRSALARHLGAKRTKALDRSYAYRTASRALTQSHFSVSIVCLWPDPIIERVMAQMRFVEAVGGAVAVFVAITAIICVVDGVTGVGRRMNAQLWLPRYVALTALATSQLLIVGVSMLVVDAPVPGFVYQAY